MPPSSKNKWHLDGDRLTAEFSSGQLVIAICVSLFIALTCFLLGVLVGRYDGSARVARQEAPRTVAPLAESSGAERGVQTSPRDDLIQKPLERPERKTPGPAPREIRTLSPLKDLDPLPPPPQSTRELEAPIPVVRPTPGDEAALRPSPDPTASVKPSPTPGGLAAASPPPTIASPRESASPPPTVVSSRETPSPPVPAEQNIAVPASPDPISVLTVDPVAVDNGAAAAPGPPAQRGAFGIQVAAFTGANRDAAAAEFQRRLRENAGLHAEIITDQQYARVVIVGYKDRVSANAACAELRKKAGFADAFVRPLL